MLNRKYLVKSTKDPFGDLTDQQKIQADLLADIAIIVNRANIDSGLTVREFERKIGVRLKHILSWSGHTEKMTIEQLAELAARIGIQLSIVKK